MHELDLLNFHGNVEGNDIFKGTVDLVVCDGFVGNVALKTAEGLASMISLFIKQSFTRNWLTKIVALMAMPVLMAFKRRVDHRRYNGARVAGFARPGVPETMVRLMRSLSSRPSTGRMMPPEPPAGAGPGPDRLHAGRAAAAPGGSAEAGEPAQA